MSELQSSQKVEIFSQAYEVPFGMRSQDPATEDITIEFTNAVSILPRS